MSQQVTPLNTKSQNAKVKRSSERTLNSLEKHTDLTQGGGILMTIDDSERVCNFMAVVHSESSEFLKTLIPDLIKVIDSHVKAKFGLLMRDKIAERRANDKRSRKRRHSKAFGSDHVIEDISDNDGDEDGNEDDNASIQSTASFSTCSSSDSMKSLQDKLCDLGSLGNDAKPQAAEEDLVYAGNTQVSYRVLKKMRIAMDKNKEASNAKSEK